MTQRPVEPPDGRPHEDDEIEILEIVGLEEEPSVPPRHHAPGADGIVLSLGEGDPGTAARDDPEPRDERLRRLMADMDNLRKQVDRERQESRERAAEALVARLLPILDSLERAAAATSGTAEALRHGVALVHRQLLELLSREGLRAVDAIGQRFDPSVHEAVATASAAQAPANVVLEELRRGYLFKGRLLRPALVRVSVEGPVAVPRGVEES
jgi:molecular chaperone GrpE